MIVTQAVYTNSTAFRLACEAKAVEGAINVRPVQVLGDGHLPPEGSVILDPPQAVVVFVALDKATPNKFPVSRPPPASFSGMS